jgi:hypothetical protein
MNDKAFYCEMNMGYEMTPADSQTWSPPPYVGGCVSESGVIAPVSRRSPKAVQSGVLCIARFPLSALARPGGVGWGINSVGACPKEFQIGNSASSRRRLRTKDFLPNEAIFPGRRDGCGFSAEARQQPRPTGHAIRNDSFMFAYVRICSPNGKSSRACFEYGPIRPVARAGRQLFRHRWFWPCRRGLAQKKIFTKRTQFFQLFPRFPAYSRLPRKNLFPLLWKMTGEMGRNGE